ncbi:hypothetical protein [Flavobacterium johnsoniae]|uniref:hypothetical protein n=1 Tax=Flavobacterium johnsoniae TaxID=986 RepID=UPI0011EDE239|nr:hypothetical protein [Flavobacterium johnsoniae]
MNILELKSNLIPKLENWVKHLDLSMKAMGKEFNNSFGFGNYILINRLENHFAIEIYGFQEITNNPKFIIEDKPNKYNLNFFLNGGKYYPQYDGLKSIVDGKNANNHQTVYSFSDLLLSVASANDLIDVLFEDTKLYKNKLIKEECDLPFHFSNECTNIFFNNISIISQINGFYSFRRHSTTLIVNSSITEKDFTCLLNKVFDCSNFDIEKPLNGCKHKFQLISELKSLAYYKVDETAIDKFIQLISNQFATSLGYKSAKSNIRLEIQDNSSKSTEKQYLTPDYMMEREDGFYDILDLKLGLLNSDFAFGDWTNSYFSNYATKLVGQLNGYKRYFSDPENAKWAYQQYSIQVENPKLIGIAGNHNNFDRKIVDRVLEGNVDDFNLISYNELADLLKQ